MFYMKERKEQVAVVVVTYNRKEMLKKNIDCLLKQTYKPAKIIVVDNHSTDGTKAEFESFFKKNKIDYIYMKKNLGGAGGFSKGIDYATKAGYDYIWGMDDDAFPEKEALEELMKAKKTFSEEVCLWSGETGKEEYPKSGLKEVEEWAFVGFFIPTSIVKKIGLPRSDFFIYFDDFEYADRVKAVAKTKIYRVQASRIKHDVGDGKMLEKTIFGKRLEILSMPNWKMYYHTRNRLLMYKWSDFKKWKQLFRYNPPAFIKLLLIRPSQAGMFLYGQLHGILGISGKRVDPK